MIGPSEERIQVKYLANPLGKDINWHDIVFPQNADLYAIVYFEDLLLHSVLLFTKGSLALVYDQLKKRHKGRGEKLSLCQGCDENHIITAVTAKHEAHEYQANKHVMNMLERAITRKSKIMKYISTEKGREKWLGIYANNILASEEIYKDQLQKYDSAHCFDK